LYTAEHHGRRYALFPFAEGRQATWNDADAIARAMRAVPISGWPDPFAIAETAASSFGRRSPPKAVVFWAISPRHVAPVFR